MRALRAADRRITLLLATVVALLATSFGGVAGRVGAGAEPPPRDDPRVAVADFDLVRLGRAATAAVQRVRAAEEAARTPKVTLPQPTPVPPARAPEPEIKLGTIEIPKIGLVHTFYHGIALTSIDRGPSHWPGTALPGTLGNAVIAGHRVTHSHPFRHIDKLVPGDRVIFHMFGHRIEYAMVRPEIVPPSGTHIVNQTPEYTATLFACHPPGSARYRYVVHLRLVQ